MKKDIVTVIITLVLSTIIILIGHNVCKIDNNHKSENSYCKGIITEIIDQSEEKTLSENGEEILLSKVVKFKAKIQSGDKKGKIVVATQQIDYMYAYQAKEIEVGKNVILVDLGSDGIQFAEYNRSDYLIALCIFFFAIIILIGKGKGVSTIISLLLTIAVIFLVYIPSILKGYNIYISTLIISIFIIISSLIIINGINKKTLCAILGNIGGIIISAILAFIMNDLLQITGVVEEDYVYLMHLDSITINLRAIVWAGIVIGSLGAVMDVAMSIASSMNELSENMRNKSFINLLKSGMNIGKDAIGTMTNTLILAYIGSALATVLLLVAYNKDLLYLFNLEMIVVEVEQAIVGSMGILFAVPSTAIISSYVYNKKSKMNIFKKVENKEI